MSTDTQWLGGQPSYQAAVKPAEALDELRSAVKIASDVTEDNEKRIKLALAMAWIEWKLSSQPTD